MVSRSFFGLQLLSINSAKGSSLNLRVCDTLYGVVARIDEELDVTLGETCDTLRSC
jgi:hypothetical protein